MVALYWALLQVLGHNNSNYFGMGKTDTFLWLCSEQCNMITGPVLVVLPNVAPIEQWKKVILKRFLSVKESDLGLMQANICDYQDKKFVFTTIQSILKRHQEFCTSKKNQWTSSIFDRFQCTVIDECQSLTATKFSQTIPLIISPFVVALSGTPKRADSNHIILEKWVGPVSYSCKKFYSVRPIVRPIFLYEQEGIVPIPVPKNKSGDKNWSRLANYNAVYEKRNLAILKHCLMSIKERKENETYSFLGLSSRIEQIKWFQIQLNKIIPTLKVAIFVSKQNTKKHNLPFVSMDDLDQYDVLLSTFGTFGKSLNVPRLKRLWLLDATTNLTQIGPRIFRGRDESTNPIPGIIYDFIDDHSPSTPSDLFGRWQNGRRPYYKSEKFYFDGQKKDKPEYVPELLVMELPDDEQDILGEDDQEFEDDDDSVEIKIGPSKRTKRTCPF